MIPSDKNPIHGQETALTFQFCTESFESALNIYVFICNECCNRIITQSAIDFSFISHASTFLVHVPYQFLSQR